MPRVLVCVRCGVCVCEFHTPDGKCVETEMGKTKTACDVMPNTHTHIVVMLSVMNKSMQSY